ncbi:hypothetical protein LTR84_009142 [Exophiala bonariae]|uniref:Uncharacterized protein n=1 Tax=Exophiala bonariae TaxID=1690606 RepID=A0AAV9MW67_9EURO|nr:hypothetical protein LTR84_009142 [Exophiala bonariae]
MPYKRPSMLSNKPVSARVEETPPPGRKQPRLDPFAVVTTALPHEEHSLDLSSDPRDPDGSKQAAAHTQSMQSISESSEIDPVANDQHQTGLPDNGISLQLPSIYSDAPVDLVKNQNAAYTSPGLEDRRSDESPRSVAAISGTVITNVGHAYFGTRKSIPVLERDVTQLIDLAIHVKSCSGAAIDLLDWVLNIELKDRESFKFASDSSWIMMALCVLFSLQSLQILRSLVCSPPDAGESIDKIEEAGEIIMAVTLQPQIGP